MKTIQEYEDRIINMQDSLMRQAFDASNRETSKTVYASTTVNYVNTQLDAYITSINETSGKNIVALFKKNIKKIESFNQIPPVFLTSRNGIEITKECLHETIDNMQQTFNEEFSSFKKQKNTLIPQSILHNIQSKFSEFTKMIQYINENSKSTLVFEQDIKSKIVDTVDQIFSNINNSANSDMSKTVQLHEFGLDINKNANKIGQILELDTLLNKNLKKEPVEEVNRLSNSTVNNLEQVSKNVEQIRQNLSEPDITTKINNRI